MHKIELQPGTIAQLTEGGTVFEDSGKNNTVIIGDTDVIAMKDSLGNWQVAENVIWSSVENLTDGDLLGHLLTAVDFVEDAHGSLLYIGPLDPAITFIKNNNEVDGPNRHILTGKWTVKLDGGNVWGTSDTLEMAWRYAIGAEFGPIDSEFVPFRLK